MNIGLIISPLLSFTGSVAKAIVVPTLTYGIHTVTSQSNTEITYHLLPTVYSFSPKSNKKLPHIPYWYAERPN